ncbi:MAG: undecaprenyl-phosphate galactose phosphotransferase WbaP [Deinococcales bacterium]
MSSDHKTRSDVTILLLFIVDLIGVLGVFLISFLIRLTWEFYPVVDLYFSLIPFSFCFPLIFYFSGLYKFGLPVPEEIKKLTVSSSFVFLVLGLFIFIYQSGNAISRAAYMISWVLMLIFLPLFRALLRELFCKKPWWGETVVVLGQGSLLIEINRTIAENPSLGFKVFDSIDLERTAEYKKKVLDIKKSGVTHLILALSEVDRAYFLEILDYVSDHFGKLTLLSNLSGISSLWSESRDFSGLLGFEIKQNLLSGQSILLKRLIDLTFIFLLFLPLLILFLAIPLLIRFTSRGGVFYGHKRVGIALQEFKAWKFRSMVENADRILEVYLQANPELRKEWQEAQKLQNDPRVTGVGNFLRRTSLDELPQIWNVLKGEMSLVGPRPITKEELNRYKDSAKLYAKVLPGMTGLWQVSGRSNTSYEQRIALDNYYVRNWSLWLDIYILARTFWVLLFRKGAV